jgi:hypothetical protein
VAVSDEYQDEGIFTGDIDKVEVDVAMPKSGASFAPSQPREPD